VLTLLRSALVAALVAGAPTAALTSCIPTYTFEDATGDARLEDASDADAGVTSGDVGTDGAGDADASVTSGDAGHDGASDADASVTSGDAGTDAPAGGDASIALLAARATNDDVTVSTQLLSTTGVSLIVVAVCSYETGTVGPVTDTCNNTWQHGKPWPSSTNPAQIQMFYTLTPIDCGSDTLTSTTPSDLVAMGVLAFSGTLSTASLDTEMGGQYAGTALDLGVTPKQGGELVVSFVCGTGGSSDGGTIAIMNLTLADHAQGGGAEDEASAWGISPGPGVEVMPQWSIVPGNNIYGVAAAFLPQ